MNCHYDTEAGDYLLPDGDKCRHDEYGDPTRHCTARRTCSQHVGWGELTCARCLGRVRMDLRAIAERSALLLPAAIETGRVDSEAANLAGPAADTEAWSWRKVAAKQGISWHWSEVEDDDDWHPYTVLTRWANMLTEDYGLEQPAEWTITNAATFLDRILGRVGQDDEQDFRLLRHEIRKCRQHLDSVIALNLANAKERGAPCPTCNGRGVFVRLSRWYPHWCTDEACERFHFETDEADRWVCPRDKAHSWDLDSYSRWIEERLGA